ncbi:MAG: SMP-30/gluconolactonase/LRE family protein [Rhizomicrobium sp.]
MKAQPFVRGLNFGEGVRWHGGRFWYSDFHQHRVSSAAPDGSVRVELEIDDRPSGLGWLPDGRLLVVAMLSQRLLRREADGRAVLHADLKGLAKFHANDMLVDNRGNAFIGCFGFDIDAFIEEHGTGSLFAEPGPPKAPIILVTPDGKAKIASPDHKFPNGMALIGSTLVVAECLIPGLTAFDLAADGTLRNRRPWATLSKDPPAIVPDGICSDSEGAIWCANALGREAVRIAEGGKILERVETSQFAYSCALGGADGRDLVIATAPTSNAVLGAKEANGMLEIARVSVPA